MNELFIFCPLIHRRNCWLHSVTMKNNQVLNQVAKQQSFDHSSTIISFLSTAVLLLMG